MFEVDITDNPHLNKRALRLLDEDLDDDEKKIRQRGIFVPRGGLVLKEFDYERHVIDGGGPIPKSWAIYVSIDHGYNNPSAILWHAVSPRGDVVTFHEIYKNKTVISVFVEMIKEYNSLHQIQPQLYMGDPSMAQKSAITGTSPLQEYRRHGIPLMQAKRDVAGGINKMNEYFKNDKWSITMKCPNLIKEIRGYSFKIFNSPKIADRNNVREEPNKKNDHAVDSSRYFFEFMPQITPQIKDLTRGVSKTLTHREDFPWEIDSGFMYANNEPDVGFGEI
jgi:hypothetical protein